MNTALRRIAVVAGFLALSCSAPARSESALEAFQAYWSSFRTAALSGGTDKVAALAEFPFKTRGPLDDDPVVSLDKAKFAAALPGLLAADPGLSEKPDTMRDLIQRTESASASAVDASGVNARVGSFVFSKTPAGWRFTMAYTGE